MEGDFTMVSALLKAGSAVSGENDREGLTPLHAAAEGGRCAEHALIGLIG